VAVKSNACKRCVSAGCWVMNVLTIWILGDAWEELRDAWRMYGVEYVVAANSFTRTQRKRNNDECSDLFQVGVLGSRHTTVLPGTMSARRWKKGRIGTNEGFHDSHITNPAHKLRVHTYIAQTARHNDLLPRMR